MMQTCVALGIRVGISYSASGTVVKLLKGADGQQLLGADGQQLRGA
jgi:hypothetical protein